MPDRRNSKSLPIEIIERWLKDEDWRVRRAAMKLWLQAGNLPPLVRTIEPPSTVYKKCVGGVVIGASIPDYAQVRGGYGMKCRTNFAVITSINGTFGGESVGISLWDKTTAYFVGDEIEIDDFDMSNEECSTGFHFFCTLEEAEKYDE